MTTDSDIREWLERATTEHSHMLVVCDTFDYTDYPVFVSRNDDVEQQINLHSTNMQKVMEVYNLDKNIDAQLAEKRAFNL